MSQTLLLCVSSELRDLDSHHCIKSEDELVDENINHTVISFQHQVNQQTGSKLWNEPTTDSSSQKSTLKFAVQVKSMVFVNQVFQISRLQISQTYDLCRKSEKILRKCLRKKKKNKKLKLLVFFLLELSK